jgi:hypothetical protein
MDDINKLESEKEPDTKINPESNKPHNSMVDESNKYGPDYNPNIRIDMHSTARLDATPPVVKKPGFDGPALVVLQWLSYALWGGTVIAMSVLVAAVLSFYITKPDIGDTVLYGLAAVLVLLPISLICDVLYLKHEPDYRTRSSSVVMTVHAVLFALFGIGSLITVAFSVVSLMVGSSGHDGIMVTLYSSIIITLLFAMLFLRTVLPKKYAKIRYLFMTIMIISVVTVCAFGIFGPIAEAQLTRNDKLIENNLSTVSEGINTYASDNSRLPTSLNDVKLTGDAKKLVTDKLVTYKKDSSPSLPSSSYYSSSKVFYYQLCVNYKKESTDRYTNPEYASDSSISSSSSSAAYSSNPSYGSGYSSYVTTVPHPAGPKCYKLISYNYDVIPMVDKNI